MWVVIGDEPLNLDIQGDLAFEFSGQRPAFTYIFAGTGVIKAVHFTIEVTAEDIVVNGQKLGQQLNATVERNGEVRLGAFIPTFK